MKTSRRNPVVIRKTEFGEFAVVHRGKPLHDPATYFASDLDDARATAAAMVRWIRKGGAR